MFQARIIEKRSRYDLIPIQIYSSTRIIDKTTDGHWKGHREEVQSDGERCTVRKVSEREIQPFYLLGALRLIIVIVYKPLLLQQSYS